MTPPLSSNSCADRVFSRRSTLPPASAVEALGETIAALAARLHAATYELLVLLREFDAQAGWNNGFLSCAHWLHWRTGIDLGAAREKVRVAKALAQLPRLSGAMQRGEISYAKVRALSRVATLENEAQLLDIAYAGTAAHVERVVRAWRRCDRIEEAQDTEHRHLGRSVTIWVDDDGMLVLRARLTPELGAVVQRALEAASERLYQESKQGAAPEAVAEEVTPAQRRADALGLMAECALAADLDRGAAGDRYQVVLHSCDASVVVMREGPDGSVLDVGRKTRTVPTAIRRAIAARDAGCRFPGCRARRCDAHHITHWADGGATSLDNLLLLCRRHHRLVHEGGYEVALAPGGAVFIRPDGRRLDASPPLALRGAHDHDDTIGAQSLRCWDGTPFSLVHTLDVLRGHEVVRAATC